MFILPDPNHPVNSVGEYDAAGTAGPGYASVKLVSNQPIMKDRTHSGRLVTRAVASQYWQIDVTYNPMTRDEFDVLFSFLLTRRGGLLPFYISLPQYLVPKDSLMVSDPVVTTYTDPGSSVVPFTSGAGIPSKGDLFTIYDTNDSAHTKAYMVTGISGTNMYITPPLSRATEASSDLIFINPLVRVILTTNIQEYSLSVNNLYSISLKFEEAQI